MLPRYVPRVLSRPAGLPAYLLAPLPGRAATERSSAPSRSAPSRSEPSRSEPSRSAPSRSAPSRSDGTVTVGVSEPPAGARRTQDRVDAGGPFPSVRRGRGRLRELRGVAAPARAGLHHESTVPTRGSRDREARRVVTGRAGEIYYTDDHYDSFRAVLG
ncbi:ribonuclease domain-containing protein [Streptomyces phaeoluteigriseus]|uniref:ribonuclease domain-containing protein n=1 Tax=Streptomyces phaeoluteigriseus TaxID=114686 RepID=UPI00369DAE04